MFLAPDGPEIEIADTAAKFLSRVIPLDRLHGAGARAALSGDLRTEFAAMGWFGLVLPETAGGSGLSVVEHALFFREVGRHCGPVEILAQAAGHGDRRPASARRVFERDTGRRPRRRRWRHAPAARLVRRHARCASTPTPHGCSTYPRARRVLDRASIPRPGCARSPAARRGRWPSRRMPTSGDSGSSGSPPCRWASPRRRSR
jgi:hypothetical protein